MGECLLLTRRRAGESQEQFARKFGIARNFYGKLERDEEFRREMTVPTPENLTKEEVCLILRRRSGKTQRECAEEIGKTRFWVNVMERGRVPSSYLQKLWKVE